MHITIYHNENCGTSRNALAEIRAAGHQPDVVEYLKTPLPREKLSALITQAGLSVREVIRHKEPLYDELGLGKKSVGDDELLDAMVVHPILINRPIVVVERDGAIMAKLCRPSELVRHLLTGSSPP